VTTLAGATGAVGALARLPEDRGLLDSLPDATIVVDAGRTVTALNSAAERLLGYGAADLIGAPCAERLEARDEGGAVVWAAGWHPSSRLRGVRAIPEQLVSVRGGDGHELTVAVTGAYLRDQGGGVVGAVLALRDVGHRARVNSVSGIEIVSTVSHELRSPLTSVKGYTSLLLHRWSRLTDDQKKMMLTQVNHDADRVTRLIGELLDISRLETGKLVLRRQLVNVPTLTASVIDKVRMEYPELDATVTWPEGFPRVLADPDKVEQVLTNLLENACKYASPAGLKVGGTVAPGEVTVRVSDRGAGITAGDLPNVFTKFFRRSEGRPTGSGLGLWISRGIVESHGGRLVASSIPGEGSVFAFTLPVGDLEEQTVP
jgi:PAS domain S-box-containing protein